MSIVQQDAGAMQQVSDSPRVSLANLTVNGLPLALLEYSDTGYHAGVIGPSDRLTGRSRLYYVSLSARQWHELYDCALEADLISDLWHSTGFHSVTIDQDAYIRWLCGAVAESAPDEGPALERSDYGLGEVL